MQYRHDVHAMRGAPRVHIGLQALTAPLKQASGADVVAPSLVGQPDAELGQPLPQVGLGGRTRLPTRLEHLVCGEWPTGVDQSPRDSHRLVGRQGVLGHWCDAG